MFYSSSDILRYTVENKKPIYECAAKLREDFNSYQHPKTFGNTFNISFSFQDIYKEGTYFPNELQKFQKDVFDPSFRVIKGSWKKEFGVFSSAFAFLSSPSDNANALNNRLKSLLQTNEKSKITTCKENFILTERYKTLLCNENHTEFSWEDADENEAIWKSEFFLNNMIFQKEVSEVIKWAALVSSPYNFVAEGLESSQPPLDVEGLAKIEREPPGRRIIRGAQWLADVSIAQQTMIYGDLTAYFIYELVWDKNKKNFLSSVDITEIKKTNETRGNLIQKAFDLLKNNANPWLQRNVAMIILNESTKKDSKGNSMGSFMYDNAISIFYNNPNNQKEYPSMTAASRQSAKDLLLHLFDFSHEVEFSEKDSETSLDGSTVSIPRKVMMKLGDIQLEMPAPKLWENRSFDYPSSLKNRIHERDLLAERWADYTIFERMGTSAAEPIIQVLAGGDK